MMTASSPGPGGPAELGDLRIVRNVWDTVISIHAEMSTTPGEPPRTGSGREALIEEVDRFIGHVTSLCSLHDDSELQRLNDGLIEFSNVHPDLREMIGVAEQARAVSDGRFDHQVDGIVDGRRDLYGIAKGWAAERLATMIEAAGYGRVAVNAGGDVFAVSNDEPWVIGIVHPDDPSSVFETIELHRGAIATSGTAQRGTHLRGEVVNRSCTVTGPSGALADAYATAGCYDPPEDMTWLPKGYRFATVPAGTKLFYSTL